MPGPGTRPPPRKTPPLAPRDFPRGDKTGVPRQSLQAELGGQDAGPRSGRGGQRASMKRLFGVRKDKAPPPSLEDASGSLQNRGDG